MLNAPQGRKHQKLTGQPVPPTGEQPVRGLEHPKLDPEFLRHDPTRLARDLERHVLGPEFSPPAPLPPVRDPELSRHDLAATVLGLKFLPRELERQRTERRYAP